ncbi:hypothetical protein NOW01_13005 [Anoxybacillus salavatliensis]|nr:hypothetical protein [Anoxybacillus gonensis]MCQ5365907.1 hypothetical protein [Anoxybacillus gonensis]
MKKRSKQNNPEQKTLHAKDFGDPIKEVKQRNAKKRTRSKGGIS